MIEGDTTSTPQAVPPVGGVAGLPSDRPYLQDDQWQEVEATDGAQDWPDATTQPQPQVVVPQTARFEDIVVFEQATVHEATRTVPLDNLAIELADILDSCPTDTHTAYTFDVEVPGLGVVEGRLQIRSGLADLELRAQRSATATTLRERETQLKDMVDRESGGDVKLTII